MDYHNVGSLFQADEEPRGGIISGPAPVTECWAYFLFLAFDRGIIHYNEAALKIVLPTLNKSSIPFQQFKSIMK